ncbi:hypothetical protein [Litorivivens sp.]|uniref:hypothetical protein n=1 Tax=Litorivivens sp. TaxID=2020868 RepID=UPI0035670647
MKHYTPVLLTLLLMGTPSANAEDFLGSDDFAFDSSAIEVSEPHWTDGFKTALEHAHTQIPGDPNRSQSSVQLIYEGNLAEGWYLKLDTRYRYFWEDDDLAERRGGAYGKNKWQRAWLQYSKGSCTATAGRQTLIWGAVEGTFVTDIVTPFDYTEQLLTDYGNVRLPQDMLVAECFLPAGQLQAFYTPEARTDVYQHHRLVFDVAPGFPPVDLSVEPDEEWGLRYKLHGSRVDWSFMYARLYDNTPTPVYFGPDFSGNNSANPITALLIPAFVAINGMPDFGIRPELARFDLVGMATSIALGRLLLKAEVAHRDNQLLPISGATSERIDAAVGFEYTTSGNHLFNAGVWGMHLSNDAAEDDDIQVVSVGWRKTYLNDDLVMSLLGNWASSPRFGMVTVLAEYRWNDFWKTSLALSVADLSELDTPLPIIPAEESATVSITYEF